MSIDLVLHRLGQVHQLGPDKWKACCPAHPDKRPSLAVRCLPDGRILLHCFSGCDVHAVLDAVGLSFADIAPAVCPVSHFSPAVRTPFNASDALKCLGFDSLVMVQIANAMLRGESLSEDSRKNLIAAATHFQAAGDFAHA